MITPMLPFPHNTLLHEEVADGISYRAVIIWALTTPVQFGFGAQSFVGAYKALRHGSSNMDVTPLPNAPTLNTAPPPIPPMAWTYDPSKGSNSQDPPGPALTHPFSPVQHSHPCWQALFLPTPAVAPA